MGSSGGRGFIREGATLAARARRALEAQAVISEINEYLGELLKDFNNRDVQLIGDRLTELTDCLGNETAEVDRLLFGGSIAKHTYVDGLSDVDALVVVRGIDAKDPSALVEEFAESVRRNSPDGVSNVSAGNLAVTVTYTDGSEVQLLPAKEDNGVLRIASEDGRSWQDIRPRKFAEKLTSVNQSNAGFVIPVIKLAKALLQQLPVQHKLSGYHVEAIAVSAFEQYTGDRTRQAMLRHLLGTASTAVLRPIGDITGQSVKVDSQLGAARSDLRNAVATSITQLVRRMGAARSVADFKDLFGD